MPRDARDVDSFTRGGADARPETREDVLQHPPLKTAGAVAAYRRAYASPLTPARAALLGPIATHRATSVGTRRVA